MSTFHDAKHLATDRPLTSRQQGQEQEARALANANLSMLARGFHAVYSYWTPRHGDLRPTIRRVTGTEAA